MWRKRRRQPTSKLRQNPLQVDERMCHHLVPIFSNFKKLYAPEKTSSSIRNISDYFILNPLEELCICIENCKRCSKELDTNLGRWFLSVSFSFWATYTIDEIYLRSSSSLPSGILRLFTNQKLDLPLEVFKMELPGQHTEGEVFFLSMNPKLFWNIF